MAKRSTQPLAQYLGQWEGQSVRAIYYDHGQRRIVTGLFRVNTDGKSVGIEIQQTNEHRRLYFHGVIEIESLTAVTSNESIFLATTSSAAQPWSENAEYAPLSRQERILHSLMTADLFLALGVFAQSGYSAPTFLLKIYTVGIALVIASPALIWFTKHRTSRLLR